MRVRGLKQGGHYNDKKAELSHPVRVRGLKHATIFFDRLSFSSHPVRVRGLKRTQTYTYPLRGKVAPRAGAWVETQMEVPGNEDQAVAPRAGAWVET